MQRVILALFALGGVATASIAANIAQTPTFDIAVKVFDGDKLMIAPKLRAREHEAATILTRDMNQQLHIVTTQTSLGQFGMTANYVKWTTDGLFGDDATLEVSPDGKLRSVTLDVPDAKSGRIGKLRIEIMIRPAS
jgi:hypothetical protein